MKESPNFLDSDIYLSYQVYILPALPFWAMSPWLYYCFHGFILVSSFCPPFRPVEALKHHLPLQAVSGIHLPLRMTLCFSVHISIDNSTYHMIVLSETRKYLLFYIPSV